MVVLRNGLDDAPAIRHNVNNSLHVPAPDDHGHNVKDPLICLDLPRQAIQRVPVALDLKGSERAVNNGNIRASLALANPQLVQDQGVLITSMILPQQIP
jgi:hypothetical protein